MSISSLIGLAERLFSGETNNSTTTGNVRQQEKPQRLQGSRRHHEQDSGEEDRFTPSSTTNANNSSDNVLALQFERLRLSTFKITSTPAATPAGSVGTPTAAPAATAATTAPAASNSAITGAASAAVPTTVLAQTTVPAAQASPTGAALSASSGQDLLQSFNAQLTALGLTPQEIQAFDQAANLIQQFSPAAFQDLLSQLNALANQFASQAAPSPTAGSGAATSSTAGAGAGTPGFQLTELSLRFSGVSETIQSGKGAAASTTQISAYNLQLQEVRVTLSNPTTGQVGQLQAPQPVAATAKTSAS